MTTRLERATERLREARPLSAEELAASICEETGARPRAVVADLVARSMADEWTRRQEAAAPRQEWRGPRGRWLSVYHVQLAYGGSEEGGWWYTAGDRIECVDVTGRSVREVSDQMRAKYSELDDPRGTSPTNSAGVIECEGPTAYPGPMYTPTARPRYE